MAIYIITHLQELVIIAVVMVDVIHALKVIIVPLVFQTNICKAFIVKQPVIVAILFMLLVINVDLALKHVLNVSGFKIALHAIEIIIY